MPKQARAGLRLEETGEPVEGLTFEQMAAGCDGGLALLTSTVPAGLYTLAYDAGEGSDFNLCRPRPAAMLSPIHRYQIMSLIALAMATAGCLGDVGQDAGAIQLMDGGSSDDTWDSFAADFFVDYCVGCHGGHRNYTTREHVERDAHKIRCGVSSEALLLCQAEITPRLYPVGEGPAPDEDTRRRLVAWVEADLP